LFNYKKNHATKVKIRSLPCRQTFTCFVGLVRQVKKNRTLNFDNTIFAAGAETHNQKQEKRILANKMF
jgi:hypothetical protein